LIESSGIVLIGVLIITNCILKRRQLTRLLQLQLKMLLVG